MKILFIQKVKAIAGSEKYFFEIIPELIKRGIQIEFLCVNLYSEKSFVKPFIDKLKDLGIDCYVAEVKSSKSILNVLYKVKKIINQSNYDLIHTHLIHADFWCAILKRIGVIKPPIVSTKHGYEEMFIAKHGFDGSKIKHNLYYKICRFSEKHIKNSYAVSNGLKNLFIDSKICNIDKIRTIHHGFDLPDVFKDCSENNKFRYSPNQIVLLGRIIPFKGHLLALKSLLKLKSKINDFKLLIIGEGDEDLKNELVYFAKENNLTNNIEFLGFRTNVYDYLKNSDVMLVPSISEGFGLVFLEAMNAHLPIVGFDVSATNEIVVNKQSGILITPYDTDLMGEELIRLLQSQKLRNHLSNNAKKRLLDYFSLDRMVCETICFYEDTLSN